ncbi:uncharacterized protein PG998_008989 [Apiospora kogelbergensis]|uniref:uncharacterized protein n=1 Tax=Apiospora kogelbergensis TaxID=1337665 RepID=UPI00312D4F47
MLLPFANSPRFRIEALSTDACLLVARRRKANTADDGGDVQLVEINGARLAYRIAGPADAPAGSPRCMAAAAWVRVTLCTALPGCVAPLSLSTLGFRRQPAADGAPSTTRGKEKGDYVAMRSRLRLPSLQPTRLLRRIPRVAAAAAAVAATASSRSITGAAAGAPRTKPYAFAQIVDDIEGLRAHFAGLGARGEEELGRHLRRDLWRVPGFALRDPRLDWAPSLSVQMLRDKVFGQFENDLELRVAYLAMIQRAAIPAHGHDARNCRRQGLDMPTRSVVLPFD